LAQITTIAALEELYERAHPLSISKVATRVTPLYRRWIETSRFTMVATAGSRCVDVSPRGDKGSVVNIIDEETFHLPDWRGNNRLDSLRNIVEDGRISLLFMVPGCQNVVRVNGDAILTTDPDLIAPFERRGLTPKTVIVVKIRELYFQCAKALMRSGLWNGEDESKLVPTAGDFLKEAASDFDGKDYDEGYDEYAKTRMW
jgi:uncharacterized protein